MELPFQLPDDRPFDVVGFGTNAVDYLIGVNEFPAFGGKANFDSYIIESGGEVASTIFGLQKLGFKTAYSGSFGDDEAGRIGMASLVNAGVDISGSRIVSGAKTQVAFILIDKDSGERTILWQRDELLAFSSEDAPSALAGRGSILHMTPHDTTACVVMARAAREAGTIVSLDIDNCFEGVEDLLPLVDICLTSETFPAKLTGLNDLKPALTMIRERYECAVVGSTLGGNGSIVFAGGEFFETPAHPVPGGCVDTTGAGDAFRTGFLYSVLRAASIKECCDTANVVAALKCRQLGARQGLPTIEEIQTLLKKV